MAAEDRHRDANDIDRDSLSENGFGRRNCEERTANYIAEEDRFSTASLRPSLASGSLLDSIILEAQSDERALESQTQKLGHSGRSFSLLGVGDFR